MLVKHITSAFRDHLATKYQNARHELLRHNQLCDQLDTMFGDVPTDQFGPLKLKAFREDLVAQGLARKYCDRLTNCLISILGHAVAVELVDVAKVTQLEQLEPLRYGQTSAPETEEVKPANLEHVRQTAKHLTPIVKAMLRIQIATGMQPKDALAWRRARDAAKRITPQSCGNRPGTNRKANPILLTNN